MEHVTGSAGIMTVAAVFLIAMIVVGLINKTLFYYLGASYMPHKIASIAPAAHELDELDEDDDCGGNDAVDNGGGGKDLHEDIGWDNEALSYWSFTESDNDSTSSSHALKTFAGISADHSIF
jgi:hypothetical protein